MNNDEFLDLENQTPPVSAGNETNSFMQIKEDVEREKHLASLYPLDWKTTDVKLAKGRFTHTLLRPSNELLIRRADELDVEIPIAKDGSYAIPDATMQEEIDAKYALELQAEEPKGYKGNVPTAHLAAAFQGLFQQEIYVDPDCDTFGDEITILEEIGLGDEPDFVIKHILSNPINNEKELKKVRQKFNSGRLHPDKRRRQKYVEKSNLRSIMAYYEAWFLRSEGAKIDDRPFSPERSEEFLAETNALTQRAVVKAIVQELTGNLLD